LGLSVNAIKVKKADLKIVMKTIEFRSRCPQCQSERPLFGPFLAGNPAELDLIETKITGRTLMARCSACNRVEEVAMFIDGKQVEPWQDADEAERLNGSTAGPLPPKPWPDTN
jgi:hypothetical protein